MVKSITRICQFDFSLQRRTSQRTNANELVSARETYIVSETRRRVTESVPSLGEVNTHHCSGTSGITPNEGIGARFKYLALHSFIRVLQQDLNTAKNLQVQRSFSINLEFGALRVRRM